MAGPQRKRLRDVLAEQQFLESLGASVPTGAPMGQEFAAPDLTMDDYARFGMDPNTMQGSGEMPLLPDALVQAAMKGEDALTGDIAQDYGNTTLDAFNMGTKKIARGYGQALGDNDGLSGLTQWEAQRNAPGAADGDFDKYNSKNWNAGLNIGNGLIEAMSAPAAPLFGPVFETGLKQAGVENGNLSDTMLGRNFVEPVAEATGIEPQAIFDTTLNATMAAPFAKQIGRAANKGAHGVLDAADNLTGMADLFPEDLLPENRTAKNLPRRFGNTMSEVFGMDPDDPGINLPWITREPRAQGDLSPWLQDNLDLDTPPIDQPSLDTPSSEFTPYYTPEDAAYEARTPYTPPRVRNEPEDAAPRPRMALSPKPGWTGDMLDTATSDGIDLSLPPDVQRRVKNIMRQPGEYKLPPDDVMKYQRDMDGLRQDDLTPTGRPPALNEDWAKTLPGDDEYPTLEQHRDMYRRTPDDQKQRFLDGEQTTIRNSGGGPVRPSADRERLKQAVADIDQQQNPSVQPEQRGMITDPSDPSFFGDLLAESNRRDRGLLPPEPAMTGPIPDAAFDADGVPASWDPVAEGDFSPQASGFSPRTTLDQVPDINSNQGASGGLYQSSMSPFMRRLGYTHESDNIPAPQGEGRLLQEDASRNIVDDMVEEFPEQQFPVRMDVSERRRSELAPRLEERGFSREQIASLRPDQLMRLENDFDRHINSGEFTPAQAVDETFESPNPTPWSGAYNPSARATADFRQSRDAPDWDAHGIRPSDPARIAYERQRLIMAEQARSSAGSSPRRGPDPQAIERTLRANARTEAEVMDTVRRVYTEEQWNALSEAQREAIMAGIRGGVPENQRNLMLSNLDDERAEGMRRVRALQSNRGRVPDAERVRGSFGQEQDAFGSRVGRDDPHSLPPQYRSEVMPPEMRRLVEQYDEQAFGDHLREAPPPDWDALGFDENHPARQAYENVTRALGERDASVRATGRNMWSLPRERYRNQKRTETSLAADREALRDFMRTENYTDRQVNTLSRTSADAMMSRMQYANETRARLRDALIARNQNPARLNTMTYNELVDMDRMIGRDGAAIRNDGSDMVADQGIDAVREQVRPYMNRIPGDFGFTDREISQAGPTQIGRYADYKQDAIVKGNKKYDEVDARRKQAEARRKAKESSDTKEPTTVLDTTGKPITTFPDGGVLKMNSQSGGRDYQHYTYSYESPHLPSKVDLSFSVNSEGRADIAIGGNWEANRGILGPAVVRELARHLKKAHGAKNFAGTRVTGVRAGKSIEQRVRFSGPGGIKPSAKRKAERAESVRDTVTDAVKNSGYKREGDVTTFSDGSTLNHITDYSYGGPHRMAIFEYKKPDMKHAIEIELRINKDEKRADISILGDNEHVGAFGTGTVRNMARYFKNEYGVQQFDGYRVTGANPKRDITVRTSGAAPEKPSAKARKAAREKAKKKERQSPLSNDEFLEQAASPVEMFDRHTKGGVGRGDQGARDGILSTPNLRDLTPEEAASIASKNPHLRQDKSGQYIGGPRGVKSRKQINKMRERFDAEVEKGLIGAQWYSRAREANVRNNSGKERQSLAAKEQAQMSAQATPDTNMNWAIQLRNDYEAGIPSSKAKTGRQAETYLRARTEGIGQGHNSAERLQDRLGKKTGIYGEHLDPNVPFATTGTNDIWHARGFGYTNNDGSMFSRALTAQEHRFLDYETVLAADRANKRKMGGRSDWTAAEIQAAPWVALKGASLAKKHNKGKAVKSGKKPMMSEEEGIAKAGETYPDLEDKYTANVTRESWPSQGMQMFPEWDMSKATAQERADWDAKTQNLDEGGRDPIYSETFGLGTRPSQKGVGSFEGQNNPVTISRPLVNFEKEGGKTRVGATSRSMMDMESAASGLMDFQDGSAWNKIVTHGDTGKDRSSVSIDIGRSPTMDEMQALEAIATKYGFSLANANNGASFLDFAGVDTTTTGKRIKSGMKAEIEKAVGGPAKVERGRFEGGYHDLSKELLPENAGKGLATRKTMKAIDDAAQGAPNAKNSLLHSKAMQDKAAKTLKQILETEKTKGPARADVTKLLDILARGGWKGLYNHVQKVGTQGLPAVALPLLLMEKKERKDDLSNVDMSTY